MPGRSFKRLSVPPRLSDVVLDRLSVADHVKYLYYHNRLRRVMETLQRKGGSRVALEEFGFSADWLRVVDHLARHWSLVWMYAYIHHTFPAFCWPEDARLQTVDPLSFAFLWTCGFSDSTTLCGYRFQVESPFACLFCGRRVTRQSSVFRFGVPCCGCEKRVLNVTQAYVIVADDFDRPDIVDAFRLRCREQRVLDVRDYRGQPTQGVVFGFTNRRVGSVESELCRVSRQGLSVFTVGKSHVANDSRARPIIGGVALHRDSG